jgi:hypothetical protein
MSPLDAYEGSIERTAALSVTDADALSESPWFADHPDRLFRARAESGGLWLIRRQQGADFGAYLRAFSRSIAPCGDCDSEIAFLWLRAAFPDWPSEHCRKRARKPLRRTP